MSFKLYYFNTRGLVEPIRIMLSYGGIDFEDIRAPLEKFPAILPEDMKQKCRWGQVPLLEFEGKKLHQSMAIGRYLARRFGLVGKDDFEAAQCDEFVDTSREATLMFYEIVKETDETKVPALKENLTKTCHEKYLTKFEELAKANGGNGKLVGDKLTWADISLFYLINHVKIMTGIELLSEDLPCLKKVHDNVLSQPNIQKWLEMRPKTLY